MDVKYKTRDIKYWTQNKKYHSRIVCAWRERRGFSVAGNYRADRLPSLARLYSINICHTNKNTYIQCTYIRKQIHFSNKYVYIQILTQMQLRRCPTLCQPIIIIIIFLSAAILAARSAAMSANMSANMSATLLATLFTSMSIVHLHVGHHVSHPVGHHSVIWTLCEGSETLLEWKSEKVWRSYGRTDRRTDRGRC